MLSKFFVVGQIFTCMSYCIFWISLFKKDKSNMLLWENISNVFAIIAFLLLGTYDGIKSTVYVIIRNTLGQVTDKKDKYIRTITFFIMLIVLLIMYSFKFEGISTICVGVYGISSLYGSIMCREQGFRIFEMIGSLFYNAFMFFSGNIAGTICETICFVMILSSYLKYKMRKEQLKLDGQKNILIQI